MSLACHPIAELFPRMSAAERAALREDIRQHGVRVPIVLYQGAILDGRHRYEACQALGIDCPTVEWDGRPWLLAQSLNLMRRHVPADQVAAIRELADLRFPDVARGDRGPPRRSGRAGAGRRDGRRGRPRSQETLASHEARVSGRTSAAIGARIGVSRAVVERVTSVRRADVGLIEQVAAGTLRLMEAERQVRRRAVVAKVAALPTGQYRVLYADPPWQYDDTRGRVAAEHHYADDADGGDRGARHPGPYRTGCGALLLGDVSDAAGRPGGRPGVGLHV